MDRKRYHTDGTIETSERSAEVYAARLKRQCKARISDGTRQCEQAAVEGGTVCVTHGGQEQRKAIRRKKNADGIRAYLGDPDIVDPFDALLGQVHEAAGNVAFLRDLVKDLPPHPTVEKDGETEELTIKKGLYGPDLNGYESPHQLLKLYNEERDRLGKLAKMAIDCGIAERQVRLAERQGEMIVNIIINVLGDPRLGLPQEKQQMGRRVAGEIIRRVDVLTE